MGSDAVSSQHGSEQEKSLQKKKERKENYPALFHAGPEIVKTIFAVVAEAASQSSTLLKFTEFFPNTG